MVTSTPGECLGHDQLDHNLGHDQRYGDLINKGIGDAGSTADLRMLWSAIVCLGLGML